MRKAGKRAAKKTGSKRKTKAPLFTIGYEQASPAAVLGEITDAKVDILVDVRAVAASRRPGFSKRQLAAALDEKGIGYVHLQKLGTPAEGRLAARAGDYETLGRIFDQHMKTEAARQQLDELVALARSGKSIALLCYCRDPAHCHRSRISALVKKRIGVKVSNLIPRLF
jgi:uncharacterized protein (DUF488 family)